PVEEALEAVAGLQAQAPRAPYVALWSRLAAFDPAELEALLLQRAAVRTWLMRATVHLVTARDARAWAPVFAEVRARRFAASPFARRLAGLDLGEVADAVHALLDEAPRRRTELSRALAERWPEHDAESLGYTAAFRGLVVQPPPRGLWTASGPARLASMATWIGAPEDVAAPAEILRRGLAGFGPATAADLTTWSGIAGVAAALGELDLVTFSDARGRELVDLRDAPRPDPRTAAPPRFLPEYDNVLLSHADRARIIDVPRRVPLPPGNGGTSGTLLVDGFWRATWRLTDATLRIERFAPWATTHDRAVMREAEALMAFLGAHDVVVA
ncbi:MAG TPA: winged helix DNA-binding domain-containing protein, partial [Baekduia sp.]|nr:winged helix DNA-binding domain-containing protein [Baekduia sp.]